MPVHDWSKVDSSIFHHFHHDWIAEIARALNRGVLSNEYQDIHLLVVDLMPPTYRDPNGIQGAIWKALADEKFEGPPGKRLTLGAYEADTPVCAYVDPVAVGDTLPEMPLFLKPGAYVSVALESTYMAAWEAVPARWRSAIES